MSATEATENPVTAAWRRTAPGDLMLVDAITKRAWNAMGAKQQPLGGHRVHSPVGISFDLIQVHDRYGLDLATLTQTSDRELVREIVGIGANLDRETGELRNGYQPRYLSYESEEKDHG